MKHLSLALFILFGVQLASADISLLNVSGKESYPGQCRRVKISFVSYNSERDINLHIVDAKTGKHNNECSVVKFSGKDIVAGAGLQTAIGRELYFHSFSGVGQIDSYVIY